MRSLNVTARCTLCSTTFIGSSVRVQFEFFESLGCRYFEFELIFGLCVVRVQLVG